MTDFNININVNTKGAAAGLNKVNRGVNRLSKSANRAHGSLGRMFSLLVAVRSVRSGVRVLADYSDAIQTISAVTGETGAQLERLNQTAKKLGITTSFTATQAAEGLTLLARAGFSVDESIAAIPATLNLAKAGAIGLAQATEIAANTLRAFGIEAENTSRVVDVLALTANTTNTNITQLGQSMKFAAPIARSLGVSLEATGSALGVLADSGIKGSLSGTSLRQVMASLEAPTRKAQRALASLGLSVEDVQVSSVGLAGAFKALAASGATPTEIFALFTRRSSTAASVLLENVQRLEQLDVALNNAAGTGARMAEVMDEGLGKALLRVKSAIQGGIIALGDSGITALLVEQFDNLALRLRAVAGNLATVGKYLDDLGLLTNTTAKNLREMEKAARLNELGAQISFATREMNNLNRAIQEQESRGGSATAGQIARLEQLQAAIDATKQKIREQADAQKVLNDIREAAKPTVDSLLARLERQKAALADLTEETKIQARTQDEVSRLLLAGEKVSPAQREAIANSLKEIEALKQKRAALESILGPQMKNEQQLAAFKALLDEGVISLSQFRDATAGLAAADPFQTQVESLRQANEQLQIRANNQGIQERQLLIELELRRQGKELTDAERDSLTGLLTEHQKLTDKLNEQAKAERERQAAASRAAALADAEARRKANLIKELDVTGQLIEKERELLALREEFPLLADEINRKLEDIQLRALESSTALGDGFTRALIKVRREAEDLASVGESIVNAFADQATEALVKFAETGQFKFKEFASAILKDITRIIARLLVMQAISAALGGVGGGGVVAGGSALTGLAGRESGGTVQPERSFIVGENGPELFTPNKTGTITPSAATQAQNAQPQPVTVQVVNVDDPEMVPQSINDGSSDEAIINVLSRNRDKLRGIL